jgi:hypothetical protein
MCSNNTYSAMDDIQLYTKYTHMQPNNLPEKQHKLL